MFMKLTSVPSNHQSFSGPGDRQVFAGATGRWHDEPLCCEKWPNTMNMAADLEIMAESRVSCWVGKMARRR
jgi:hypothetical protein